MTRTRTIRSWSIVLVTIALATSGCATKKYVRGQVTTSEQRTTDQLNAVGDQVEAVQTRAAQQGVEIGEISGTAREALDRAIAAGKLAEGKFLYEVVLNDDEILFGFDQSTLSETAAAHLAGFAARIRERNENVFIEIQGHTDSTGSEPYNLKLGERRAEAVRRHLSSAEGLALHRMATISYGESVPVTGNDTLEGRAENRRVVLVVLK